MIAPTVLHALKPAEVEHAVNPHQDVVVGDQVAQRAGKQQFALIAHPTSQHPTAPNRRSPGGSGQGDFFNRPLMNS